ncbi:MAG TPA: hypothetical protein VMU69_07665 [Bradyrhizobium sp.]|nr:hypothetical protein [Bradyrhizobium sp.]
MENSDIELFLHAQGMTPQAVTASPEDTLRKVLLRAAIIPEGKDEVLVFVGECEEALKEASDIEDGVDEHEPIDIDLTLDVLEIHRHRHVHYHRCHHIAVEVNFGGKTKRHEFSPATTIAVVTQWARKKFPNLDPAAAAEYVLQIAGTATQPRPSEHLGEVVSAGTCSIGFDLVKEITPQG